MRIAVVTAGMSQSTKLLGDRLAAAVRDAAGGPVEVVEIEVRTLASDLVNYLATRVPSPALTEAFGAVGSAAGVIAVTPVWNGSYGGLFKLFFDAIDEGTMARRPVLLAATGGTARHSLAIDQAMLPLFFYLKAVIAPTSVFAATADWGDPASGLAERIQRAARDFADLVRERPGEAAEDEFSNVPDFAALVGR